MTRPAAAMAAGRDARVLAASSVLPLPPDPDDRPAVRRALARDLAARYAVRRAAETWRTAHRAAAMARATREVQLDHVGEGDAP